MKKKIIIVGCGGHAKSVCDSLLANQEYEVVGFIDKKDNKEFVYNHIRCIGTDYDLKSFYNRGVRYAALGIGYLGVGEVREKVVNKLIRIGFELPVIIDPTAIFGNTVSIGNGTFVGKRVVVNADVNIGRYCIVNSGSVLEHDVQIGEWSHIAVGACICGGVNVAYNSFIGANATVIQNVNVAECTIVGAGAVVIKDTQPETKWVGVPARNVL